MVFKANAQQAPVQWHKEITRIKLNQFEPFFHEHLFIETTEKRHEKTKGNKN